MRKLPSIAVLLLVTVLAACAPDEPTETKQVNLRFTSGVQGEGFPDEGGVVTFDQRWEEEVRIRGKVVSVVSEGIGPIRLLHRPLAGETGPTIVKTVQPGVASASTEFRNQPLRGLWAVAYDPALVQPEPDGRINKIRIEIRYRP